MQGSWGEQGVMWRAGSKRAHNHTRRYTTTTTTTANKFAVYLKQYQSIVRIKLDSITKHKTDNHFY